MNSSTPVAEALALVWPCQKRSWPHVCGNGQRQPSWEPTEALPAEGARARGPAALPAVGPGRRQAQGRPSFPRPGWPLRAPGSRLEDCRQAFRELVPVPVGLLQPGRSWQWGRRSPAGHRWPGLAVVDGLLTGWRGSLAGCYRGLGDSDLLSYGVWPWSVCCYSRSFQWGKNLIFFQLIITERLQTNFQKSFLPEAVGPRTLPCCFRGWPLPEVGAWEREGASCYTRPAVQNRGLGQSARLWSCISSSVKWDKDCSSSDPPKQGHVFV